MDRRFSWRAVLAASRTLGDQKPLASTALSNPDGRWKAAGSATQEGAPFPIDSRAPRRCGTLKRGSMEKNVVLPQDLLTAVAEIARAEGKTPEEVIEEATRRLVRVRGLRSFVAENRRLAQEQGWTEADVPCLIDECRRESRGR